MCCPTIDRPTPRTKKLEEPRGGEAENVVQDVLVRLEKLQTVSVPRCLDERKPHLLEEGALKKNKRCAGGGARKCANFRTYQDSRLSYHIVLDNEVVEIGRVTSTDQHEAKFQTSTSTLPCLNQTGESFLLKFEVGLDWLKQDGLSNP